MRKLLILLILIACASPALALSGLSMMKVEIGARPVGMGGAFTAVVDDPMTAVYNPAGVGGVRGLAGVVGHIDYWENTAVNNGYVVFEKHNIVFNAGIRYAEIGDLKAYGDVPSSEPLYLFENQTAIIKAGAAFRVHRLVTVGASIGWYFEKLDDYRGDALGADFGLLVTPIPRLTAGLAVLNLGTKMKINIDEYDLPTTTRFGVSYELDRFRPALDIVYFDDETRLHLGGEYTIREIFTLRAGYRSGYDSKDMSAGAGFRHRNFRIDYAYLPFDNEHDNTHMFNLTFTL